MISVSNFVNEWLNKAVKSPHGISGQCVSVPSEFAVENNWPELFGAGDDTAWHIWENGVPGYTRILNVTGSNGNFPASGDFVFFNQEYGGGEGHTGLVQAANLSSVTLFEQNDPLGSGAHSKTYNYTDIVGWFHHPSAPPPAFSLVTIKSKVNVRTAPHVTAPIFTTENPGAEIECSGTVTGDTGTVNGHTSNQWYLTEGGHYFCLAATL